MTNNFDNWHKNRHTNNIKYGLLFFLIAAAIAGFAELLKYLGLL